MEQQLDWQQFKEEWLADIVQGKPSTVELGNRFAHKLLTQWLDMEATNADVMYCDGSGDGGIDAAYLEIDVGTDTTLETHTWYLIQSKYGKAFQGTSTLLKEGQKLVDTLDNPHKRLSSLTYDLLEQLSAFRRRASERDRIVLVFATEEPLTNAQRKTLRDVRAMGRDRLGPIFDVEAVAIDTIYRRTLEDMVASSRQIRVPLVANLVHAADGTDDLLVCSVSLIKLFQFLESYQEKTGDIDQLYEKNVRRFLGGKGRVNKAIQQTLKEEPEQFGYYNNGITIVVTDFSISENGALRLTDPYIVNGCQTTRTIWDVCRQRLKSGGTGFSPELHDWEQRAEKGIVVAKIVKVGTTGEDLLQKITRYTNSQNAVKEKDFIALVADFRSWRRELADRYHIFLEIQRGAWDAQRAYQKQHPAERKFTQFANASDLLRVYGAGWLGEVGHAFGRSAAFLPSGEVFKKIVNPEDESDRFDVDDLYAAFHLQQAADAYRFGRTGPDTRKVTRYLFYHLVVELLKGLLVRSALTVSRRTLTAALNKIVAAGQQALLLDTAIEALDEYLTPGTDNSIFDEPHLKRINHNLHAYLKSEQIGNGEIYKRLIADYIRQLGKGKPSPREILLEIIKAASI
jgi:hypothetical protein